LARGEFTDFDDSGEIYILGLSGNDARISIRIWQRDNLSSMFRKFGRHLNDIQCSGKDGVYYLSLWKILDCLGGDKGGLLESILRSIFTDSPYPHQLLTFALRVVAKNVTKGERFSVPVSILRGYCNRLIRVDRFICSKEFSMALDQDRSEPEYHWGRLFAAYVYTQRCAYPSVKRGVDSQFSAAMTRPHRVMGNLHKLHKVHLAKLPVPLAVYFSKFVGEICGRIDDLPVLLSPEQQAVFILGYEHQLTSFYTSSKKGDSDE